MNPLWFWDIPTWVPRKVNFFCGACFQQRTTVCGIDCILEVGHGERRKYEIICDEYNAQPWLVRE